MSDNIATQLLVIQQLLEQGKVGEALAELQVIIARYPEQGKAQAMLGSIYLHHLADFTAAEEAFRIAMRQAPAYPTLYYDYGELLLRLDRATETVAVLNKSLEVPGIEKDKIYSLFGNLYEREKKWEEAIEYYTKAIFYSLSDVDVSRYQNDLNRVKIKMNL